MHYKCINTLYIYNQYHCILLQANCTTLHYNSRVCYCTQYTISITASNGHHSYQYHIALQVYYFINADLTTLHYKYINADLHKQLHHINTIQDTTQLRQVC